MQKQRDQQDGGRGASCRVRILIHGGDNMLGRAVQLTFPIQAPGEELITDSCTAQHYLDMCLNHPSTDTGDARADPNLDEIRKMNADHGSYLWGDYVGLKIFPPPDLRLLNLETAVTRTINNPDVPTMKGINYHMHSDNYENIMEGFRRETHSSGEDSSSSPVVVNCANNHGIDYGRKALDEETLALFETVNKSEFQTIGLGKNLRDVMEPAAVKVSCRKNDDGDDDGEIERQQQVNARIFPFSTGCSGTPKDWWATETKSGLFGLPGIYSHHDVNAAMDIVKPVFKAGGQPEKELRIVSIHWGPNWAMKGEGDEQVSARREFAHRLIDECGVDLVYGHSSHHARGIEVYKNKLILYGTGDIINDYEGFENAGEERYIRLGGIYVIDLDLEESASGGSTRSSCRFRQLRIVPMCMNRLQLQRVKTSSGIWKPRQRRLEYNCNNIRDFCDFINEMSAIDALAGAAGGGNEHTGQPLVLEYVESDPQIPGGPILRS